jgi:hypothetical protein
MTTTFGSKTIDCQMTGLKPIRLRDWTYMRSNQKVAECYWDVLVMWFRSKGTGTVVSGYRRNTGLDVNPHFWMESGKFVHEIQRCQVTLEDGTSQWKWCMLTFDKDTWYKEYDIGVEKRLSKEHSFQMLMRGIESGLDPGILKEGPLPTFEEWRAMQ